jgi:4-amino-4-deoxy-L-arabinose transferase-like glycosyltransferase
MVSSTHPTETGTTEARPAVGVRLHMAAMALFAQPPRRWLLLAIVLLGLALRLWFIAVNQLEPYYSPADDGDYYQRALRFATTGQYIDDFWLIRPPLHVMLFALMIKISTVTGDIAGVPLVRALQTVMIVATIPLGYGLARRLFNVQAGLLFAFILAVWFPLVELPVHLFSEPTFFFFLVLHLWLLVLWRDKRHWPLLVASGVALGFASLARSPTLYGGAFVVLWLVLEQTRGPEVPVPERLGWRLRSWRNVLRPHVIRPVLIFALATAAVVLPWTLRNYLVYERLILIDTIGPVNLWLHIEKYEARGVEMLQGLPQADRQVFAVEDTMRIFREDPAGFFPLLFRNAEFHFRHIWKAQFVEDFLVKRSFYGRPLRELWPLGAAGDLLWFGFTLAGLAALVAPLHQREGMFRWLALCWIGYTVFAMMIMHIEPRYLLPVWLLLALYGSWLLANPRDLLARFRQHRLHGILAAAVAVAFLALVFSYRNYPDIIARGIERETHNAAGMRALAAQEYDTAVQELQVAVDAQPTFTDTRANLALALAAQGNYDAAWQALGGADSQRMSIIRGMLERAQNDPQAAAVYFTDAETRAGEDAQQFALEWLPVPPVSALELGSGRDLGYIAGFSPGETVQQGTQPPDTYRWLQGEGQIVVPLPQPLRADSVVVLRLAAGRPDTVPLTVRFGDVQALTVPVSGAGWRVYRLAVPPDLAGQQVLSLTLEAPTFIPAHVYSDSVDTRPLSLMVSGVHVQ